MIAIFRSVSKFVQDLSTAEQVLFLQHSARKCYCFQFIAVLTQTVSMFSNLM